ncbi:hypothetical protein BMMON4_04650 [Burkholderia mallei]
MISACSLRASVARARASVGLPANASSTAASISREPNSRHHASGNGASGASVCVASLAAKRVRAAPSGTYASTAGRAGAMKSGPTAQPATSAAQPSAIAARRGRPRAGG